MNICIRRQPRILAENAISKFSRFLILLLGLPVSFGVFVSARLVEIAMEAMDLLLMACHAQTLNLFVESFLRMVQKLLEDQNPNLQILATNSVILVFARLYHGHNLNKCSFLTNSLCALLILRRIHHPIIAVMISSFRNFHQCAMEIMITLNYVILFEWQAFVDYRASFEKQYLMIW